MGTRPDKDDQILQAKLVTYLRQAIQIGHESLQVTLAVAADHRQTQILDTTGLEATGQLAHGLQQHVESLDRIQPPHKEQEPAPIG